MGTHNDLIEARVAGEIASETGMSLGRVKELRAIGVDSAVSRYLSVDAVQRMVSDGVYLPPESATDGIRNLSRVVRINRGLESGRMAPYFEGVLGEGGEWYAANALSSDILKLKHRLQQDALDSARRSAALAQQRRRERVPRITTRYRAS